LEDKPSLKHCWHDVNNRVSFSSGSFKFVIKQIGMNYLEITKWFLIFPNHCLNKITHMDEKMKPIA
jgi:hypothetical protein